MAELKRTKIYRGGITSTSLNLESRECSFHINIKDKALDFRFQLASKGGGTTSVLLQVGIEELPTILGAIAQKLPENVGVMSDCASVANRRNLELLTEAQKIKDDEKARTGHLLSELEIIEEYVSEKYYQAPSGKDDREAEVKAQIEDIMGSLRSLL